MNKPAEKMEYRLVNGAHTIVDENGERKRLTVGTKIFLTKDEAAKFPGKFELATAPVTETEAIAKQNEEAEQILADAREEAAQIIKDAREEAANIVAAASSTQKPAAAPKAAATPKAAA